MLLIEEPLQGVVLDILADIPELLLTADNMVIIPPLPEWITHSFAGQAF